MLDTIKEEAKTKSPSFIVDQLLELQSLDEIKDTYSHGLFSIIDFCIVLRMENFIYSILEQGINPNNTDCFKFLENGSTINLLILYGFKKTDFSLYYVDFKTKEYRIRKIDVIDRILTFSTPTPQMVLRAYKLPNDDRINLMKRIKEYENSQTLSDMMKPSNVINGEIVFGDNSYKFDEFIEKFYSGYGMYLDDFLKSR